MADVMSICSFEFRGFCKLATADQSPQKRTAVATPSSIDAFIVLDKTHFLAGKTYFNGHVEDIQEA